MGELSGVAQIGGHNGTLGAWANLAINSGGGNVGIGTASPARKLHVYSGDSPGILIGPNASWGQYLEVGGWRSGSYASVVPSNGNLHIDALNGGYGLYLNYFANGGIDIGQGGGGTTIHNNLVVTSGIYVPGAYSTYCGGFAAYAWWGYATGFNQCQNVSVWAGNDVLGTDFIGPSDLRKKKDIVPIATDDGLQFVRSVQPIRFHWKTDGADKNLTNGYIAQQLIAAGYGQLVTLVPANKGETMPERIDTIDGVKVKSPKDAFFAANYIAAIPLLHSALKVLDQKGAELAKKWDELKILFDGDHAELMKLKAANNNQVAALKALEAKFDTYKAAHP